MKYVSRTSAIEHVHSAQCTVYEYPMKNSEMNMGVAQIIHRYPDTGYAVNHK